MDTEQSYSVFFFSVYFLMIIIIQIFNFMQKEIWKTVEGYDGLYEVSDLGSVRSKHSGEWKVMRGGKNSSGYLIVILCKDGKRKTVTVHRLVAQAFIENTDSSKTIINHIDENKENNRADNLEYCTQQYNANYNNAQYRRKHPNYRRNEIKSIYRPELSIDENLELFKAKGVSCSRHTVVNLRKDLGLIRKQN